LPEQPNCTSVEFNCRSSKKRNFSHASVLKIRPGRPASQPAAAS
jgi:hypothetical protein